MGALPKVIKNPFCKILINKQINRVETHEKYFKNKRGFLFTFHGARQNLRKMSFETKKNSALTAAQNAASY